MTQLSFFYRVLKGGVFKGRVRNRGTLRIPAGKIGEQGTPLPLDPPFNNPIIFGGAMSVFSGASQEPNPFVSFNTRLEKFFR